MSDPRDVTIIGAGIVGICTALSCRERGLDVRLIDRGEPGQETSFGNAGVISPWSIIPQAMPGILSQLPRLVLGRESPLGIRPAFWPRMVPWGLRFLGQATERRARHNADAMALLCGPSIELFRRHLEGTGAGHLLRDSVYIHAFRGTGPGSLDALEHRIRIEKGGDLELIDREGLRALEPALSAEFGGAVLIRGQARALSPGRIASALAEKAARLGVEIIRAEVRSLRQREGGWQIDMPGTEAIGARRVILCMGAWSARLLRPLGINLPLVAERGYHLEFDAPDVTLGSSVMDTGAKFVASSMSDGLRVAGHAEFGDIDAPPDPRRETLLHRQAVRAIPGLAGKPFRTWMGRRPSLPDSLPAIGAFSGLEGLFAGFGHSHYGLMMAPKTGELIADLLVGRNANTDLSALSPMRFRRASNPT